MILRLHFDAPPMAFRRARKEGKHHFNDDDYTAWKHALMAEMQTQTRVRDIAERCMVDLVADIARPGSRPKDIDPAEWKTGAAVLCVGSRDIDNLLKSPMDALQAPRARIRGVKLPGMPSRIGGVGLFADDRYVVGGLILKRYHALGGRPSTRLAIWTGADMHAEIARRIG